MVKIYGGSKEIPKARLEAADTHSPRRIPVEVLTDICIKSIISFKKHEIYKLAYR
jgi:hypothetical protein